MSELISIRFIFDEGKYRWLYPRWLKQINVF